MEKLNLPTREKKKTYTAVKDIYYVMQTFKIYILNKIHSKKLHKFNTNFKNLLFLNKIISTKKYLFDITLQISCIVDKINFSKKYRNISSIEKIRNSPILNKLISLKYEK